MEHMCRLTIVRFNRRSFAAYLNRRMELVSATKAVQYEEYEQQLADRLKDFEPLLTDDVELSTYYYTKEEARQLATDLSSCPELLFASPILTDNRLLGAMLRTIQVMQLAAAEFAEASACLEAATQVVNQLDEIDSLIEAGKYSAFAVAPLNCQRVASIHVDGPLGIEFTVSNTQTLIVGVGVEWSHVDRHDPVPTGLICNDNMLRRHLRRTIRRMKKVASANLSTVRTVVSRHQAQRDQLDALTRKWQSGVRDPEGFVPVIAEILSSKA